MMSASSERFELFQDDLEGLFDEIQENLELLSNKSRRRKKMTGEEKRQFARSCKVQIKEANKIIQEMEREAKMAPREYRGEMMGKVRQFREDAATRSADLRKWHEKEHQELISVQDSGTDGSGRTGQSLTQDEMHRRQILEGTSILERTTQSIVRSEQVALESEAIGEEVITDLGTQRETLERTRSRLQETDAELGRSRRVVRSLNSGVLKNKVVLIVIIIVEIGILIAVIIWKFFLKKTGTHLA